MQQSTIFPVLSHVLLCCRYLVKLVAKAGASDVADLCDQLLANGSTSSCTYQYESVFRGFAATVTPCQAHMLQNRHLLNALDFCQYLLCLCSFLVRSTAFWQTILLWKPSLMMLVSSISVLPNHWATQHKPQLVNQGAHPSQGCSLMLDGIWTGLINHSCHWMADMYTLAMVAVSMFTLWTRYALGKACEDVTSPVLGHVQICFFVCL